MTDDDDIPGKERPEDELESQEGEEGKKGGGKKGKGGTGAAGADKRTVSPAFFAFMASIGATMEQITKVLGQWAHLRGETLSRALNDFAKDIARASSQPQVQFDGKDVSIITTFFRYLTGRDRKPTVRPPMDNSPKGGPR